MDLTKVLPPLKRCWELSKPRLGSSMWVFIISLILQMSVNVYFIDSTYALLPEGENTIIGVSLFGTLIRSLFRSLFWSSLLWWLAAVFEKSSIGRKIYSLFVSLVMLTTLLIESFLLYKYETVYTLGIAQIVAGTNPNEIKEWSQMQLSSSNLIAFTLVLSMVIGLIFISARLLRTIKYRGISILFTLSLTIVVSISIYTIPRTYTKIKSKGQAYDLAIAPYDRLLWNTYGVILDQQAISMISEEMKKIDLGDIEITPYETIPSQNALNVIIIIGETLRKDFLHCYGFPLNNTPRIDSLVTNGEIILYNDVVSPAGETIGSLTKALTYQTNDTGGKWYEFPVLTYVLNKVGYHVNWLSNQESSGVGLQPINVIANLSKECKYVNARSIDEEIDPTKTYYDEDVLPYLKDLTKSNNQTKEAGFIQFIHLMGSHSFYKKRFPSNFARFSPDDIPVKRSKEKDQIVSDYINSIYYNDFIVAKIIEHYSETNSLVIYFSDHGEIMFDDPKRPDYNDHDGSLPQGVSVPFMVYLSPKLRQEYPKLYARIKSCRNRRIMLDLFTHSLTGLLGIQTKYTDPKLDFFSDEYQNSRRRIIEGFSGQKIEL